MLPMTLEIYDGSAIQHLPAFRNLRFAKTFFGGEDLWLTWEEDKSPSLDYPEIAYGNDVICRGGLNAIFSGEMRQITQDLETITCKALGRRVHLDDANYGGPGKLWCEWRYRRWREGKGEDRAVFYPRRFDMDNHNRIFIAPKKNTLHGNGIRGVMIYENRYDKVRRVSFDYTLNMPGNWEATLESCDLGFANFVLLWTVQGVGAQSGVKDVTLDPEKPLLYFRVRYNQAGTTNYTGNDVRLKVTNLRMWGEDGDFSRAIENPSVIHLAENAISQVQATTPISAEDDKVQESLFVRDTFTDANGTSLDAHQPDVDKERGGWTEERGNWDIQGNEANIVAVDGASIAMATIDAGVSDGIVACDVPLRTAVVHYPGICFRASDANNCWFLRMHDNGTLELYKWIAAGANLVWSSALGFEHGYTYNLMAKLRGDRIDVYTGGIWRYGCNDSFNQTATEHGLWDSAAGAVGTRFDNFEIYQALPLWPLFFEDGQSSHKALKDAVGYGDWNFRALGWGIEPGGDRLYLREADRASVRYVVPPQYARKLSARGQTDKDFYSEAWAKYKDTEGVEYWTEKHYAHLTPAGIGVNTTSTGDDLVSNVYGIQRDMVVDFGRVDENLAIEYLKQWLTEHAHPQVKSSFEIHGPVQDLHKGGAWVQPYEMEMGYLVQIPYFRAVEAEGATGVDLRDWDTTFLLVGMEYDQERGRAKLIPEGASEDLGRLIRFTREFEQIQSVEEMYKRQGVDKLQF